MTVFMDIENRTMISKNKLWILKNNFRYRKIIFNIGNQKLFLDIRNSLFISKIISQYQKIFLDIENYFLISIFQVLISKIQIMDIQNSELGI